MRVLAIMTIHPTLSKHHGVSGMDWRKELELAISDVLASYVQRPTLYTIMQIVKKEHFVGKVERTTTNMCYDVTFINKNGITVYDSNYKNYKKHTNDGHVQTI